MALSATSIPIPRRSDLLFKPLGGNGQHVVKDPVSGAYFNLPPQEAFLLLQCDGQQTIGKICAAFEQRFDEPITPEDVKQFLLLASAQEFLQSSTTPAIEASPLATVAASKPWTPTRIARKILFWRHNFFDPDRFFTWLEPKLALVWSTVFFWVALALIAAAACVLGTNWSEYTDYLPEVTTWENILLAWVVLALVTTGHEFAHGLTCKHHGAEVHEIGFMLMFFMPCFYCNVTDAWLIPEKSKRLWITAAGSYFDLCLWALATLVWRVTLPGSTPYHFAWIVMSICGGRVFININPLVKLDGYYFVSDWLEIPNLRQRSLDHVSAYLRWVLWGAARPDPLPRGTTLFSFGVVSWSFTLFYVGLMLIGMHQLFLKSLGVFGLLIVAGLGWLIIPGLIGDAFSGEVTKMIFDRRKRTAIWIGALAGAVVASFGIHIDDWVSGSFKTRATVRPEIRAPVNGFLKIAYFDEGQHVTPGTHLGMLEIPDLSSKLTQKLAEQREVEAKLRLLEGGARPEELEELRQKVQRAKDWRDRAKIDLERKTTGFKEELTRLHEQVSQAQTQLEFHEGLFTRAKRLVDKKSLPYDQYLDAERQVKLSEAQLQQAEAQKRERQVVGVLEVESELAKRQKDYADTVAVLRLLEAGSRPEEIDAEKAKLERLKEERTFLEKQQERLKLMSPIAGVIVTTRLLEKVGQYFKEGDLVCEIEEPRSMEVEIPLEELDLERVAAGMRVDLKPRSQPFQTVTGRVTRIAPQATVGKVQSTVNVCCVPDEASHELIANTTGYACIYGNQASIAEYLTHRVWRYFRTEIYW